MINLRSGGSGLGALVAVALVAAACGGAGGDDLHVSVWYPDPAFLFRTATIRADLTGFEGHTPHCSLVSGRVPSGMTFNRDCSLSGMPVEVGEFMLEIRLTASGASGDVTTECVFEVIGPSTRYYQESHYYYVGHPVDMSPTSLFPWTAEAGEVVTYAASEDELPPGLVIEPATGRVHGRVPNAVGTYDFTPEVTVTHGSTTVTIVGRNNYWFEVRPSTFQYSSMTLLAWVSRPFSTSPTLPLSDATYVFSLTSGTLPPGLTLDPSTGTISGTATALVRPSPVKYPISATVKLPDWEPYVLSGSVTIDFENPVIIRYQATTPPLAPMILANGGPLDGATYSYSLPSGCNLAAGLSLDPVSGVISGTVPPGVYPVRILTSSSCYVLVTVTHAGITFPVEADVW